jgi:HEAT repeats
MRMRASKVVMFLLAAAVVAGGIAFIYLQPPREDDPVWNGKPLSAWLAGYDVGQHQNLVEANTAMLHYGTNAIPLLLRMLAAKDSPLKLKLIAQARKHHFLHAHIPTAVEKNVEAVDAFQQLEPWIRAQVPVKSWIEVYDRRPSIISTGFITSTLGDLGPAAKDAVPSLLGMATDVQQDFVSRACAFTALGRIHSESEMVVPAMIETAKETNSELRRVMVENVGLLGKDAKPAVGTLVELLNDPDMRVRAAASNSLAEIDEDAAKKAGVNIRQ